MGNYYEGNIRFILKKDLPEFIIDALLFIQDKDFKMPKKYSGIDIFNEENRNKVNIDFEIDKVNCLIYAYCTVKCNGKTGVEMEALTGVNVCLLTIYDMCKAVSKDMEIKNVHLVSKSGGKSGDFVWKE